MFQKKKKFHFFNHALQLHGQITMPAQNSIKSMVLQWAVYM